MTHRTMALLVTLALGLLVAPRPTEAQPVATMRRIGILSSGSPPATGLSPLHQPFLHALGTLGYVEGPRLAIEWRFAERQLERLPALAAELVRLPVDVIVASGPQAAHAAQHTTTTRPIVSVAVGDAVGQGLVASLARPGGNVTGLSEQYTERLPTWLELLKAAVPQASQVAALVVPELWPVEDGSWRALQQTAAGLGVQLRRVEVHEPGELAQAFVAMTQAQADALIVLPPPLFFRHRTRLVDLATQQRLPTIWGPFREFVDVGGLMAYGPSLRDQFQRAATYVDRLLKGAKPADLPVEQPTTFELVLNLKTTQALGITISPTLLVQATEVIR
jgi:putative tryptophan/tyrosine transport system substrate-binding protein